MSKGHFLRIDKKERARLSKLEIELRRKNSVSLTEVFDSEEIPSFLEQQPLSHRDAFRSSDVTIPLNCVIFAKTVFNICPGCECVRNPKLLLPYLERELILPVLYGPLSAYREEFAKTVIQYPYVSSYAHDFMKLYAFKDSPVLCPHCFSKEWKEIARGVARMSMGKAEERALLFSLQHIALPSLEPPYQAESAVIDEIRQSVRLRNVSITKRLVSKADVLGRLRDSSVYQAIPSVSQDDLSRILDMSRNFGLQLESDVAQQMEDSAWIMRSLNLEYNPAMSVEEYLDIMLPRRQKIVALANRFAQKQSDERQRKSLQDEIWRINREVASSKSIETLSFVTDFVSENIAIILGMLIGGMLGYGSASFSGCGVGAGAGAVVSRLAKNKSIKVPKTPKKTKEWVEARIENAQERLLSTLLAKDLQVVQVYRLRKKLKKV